MEAEFEANAPDWYHTYEKWAAYPLFVMGLMFLAAFSIQVLNIQDPVDQRFARVVIPVTWLMFAIDYLIGLVLARNKLHYVRSRPLQLLALVFPPFRLLLLGHVVKVLQATASRADRARVYLLFITTLTAFVGAILVVFFELKAPNSNIRSFGDALWWVGETVSTVGYGDFYPVTIGGRLVAGMLFINGVALLSVITAGMAQRFVNEPAAAAPAASGKTGSAASTSAEKANTKASAPATAAPAPAPATSAASDLAPSADTETLTISKATLTKLQDRIAGLESELHHVRAHVGELLNPPADTPPKSSD